VYKRQQYKPPGYFEKSAGSASQPDFRQVYFWASFGLDLHREFEFDLSDRKGEVAIEITGYTKEKEFFKSSKIISVR
jgi:hypothetical protein